MARLQVPLTQAIVKEPGKVKFRDYLRYYDEPEDVTLPNPEAFAAMYGAVRKENG